jgi:uncharacterized protein (TIGR02271 family)
MQSDLNRQSQEPAVPTPGAQLIDVRGRHAHIASIHAAGNDITALLHIDDGGDVMVPVNVLQLHDDGTYSVPFAFSEQDELTQSSRIVVPVLQEQPQVSKRTIDTGKGVRVHKTVHTRQQEVTVPLASDELIVERIPKGEMVDTREPPVTRQEGDTSIIPVLEEVLVVEKRMRLVEEVRITRRRHEENASRTVTLRSEQVSVEHFDEQDSPGGPDSVH